MAKTDQPTTIKKYANRRLYNTGTSTYVTLEDLASMVKEGEDFLVYDAKTGDDITRSVLAQIIFEQENKAGQNLLPTTFLRQLIRFYGDSMQMVVPRYLEQSIDTLTREQEKFRKQLTTTFSMTPFAPLEEHVRRNMEMFERTFSMFKPFAAPRTENAGAAEPDKAASEPAAQEDNIDDLRRQMKTYKDVPVLSTNFESSVSGLYLVGLAAAPSFGPLCRFAYGAKFTAPRIAKHLASTTG